MATQLAVQPKEYVSPEGGDGRMTLDLPITSAVPAGLLLAILVKHRDREGLIRAKNRIGNQIEATYRRKTGLKAEERDNLRRGKDEAARAKLAQDEAEAEQAGIPLRAMLDAGKPFLAAPTRELEKLAMQLPVWESWAKEVRGLGALSLAQIVAECGDLANYAGPAKVWKRMGVGRVDVLGTGKWENQGRRSDEVAAFAHAYNPRRRAIMYTATVGLVNMNKGEYRDYYDAEKIRAREKWPETSAAHIDLHARRLLAKRLLRDLWRAW